MKVDSDEAFGYEISPLEYMIKLGARGSHVLFENDQIREAFAKDEQELISLGHQLSDEIREALKNALSLSEIEAKKEYLASLTPEIKSFLIRLYFQAIDRTIDLNHSKSVQ